MCENCNIIFSRSKNCGIVPKSRGVGMTIFFLHGVGCFRRRGVAELGKFCCTGRRLRLYGETRKSRGTDTLLETMVMVLRFLFA